MVARQKFMPKDTPESLGMSCYNFVVGFVLCKFSRMLIKTRSELIASGIPKEQAEKEAPIQKEVEAMLLKWKMKPETRQLWNLMNGSCHAGTDQTFGRLDSFISKTLLRIGNI